MDDIKFRAWDKEAQQMLRVTKMDWPEWIVCVGEDNPKTADEYYACERNSFKNEETDRFILMQYTGLKDKDGEGDEMCQGDICSAEYRCAFCFDSDPHTLIGVVEQDESGLWMLEYAHGSMSLNSEDLQNIKIIGTEHENPELLTSAGDARKGTKMKKELPNRCAQCWKKEPEVELAEKSFTRNGEPAKDWFCADDYCYGHYKMGLEG